MIFVKALIGIVVGMLTSIIAITIIYPIALFLINIVKYLLTSLTTKSNDK